MLRGLLGLFLICVNVAFASESPTRLNSANCAALLLEVPSLRLEVWDQITRAELDLVSAVPETPRDVVDFLFRTFPALGPVTAESINVHFSALWRRLPEVPAPGPISPATLDDPSILVRWREFKSNLNQVSVMNDSVRPRGTGPNVFEFDRRAERRLAEIPSQDVAEVLAVPWEAKAIVNWLRGRYPKQSVRRSGWGDQTFDLLWRDTFNLRRPGSVLGKVDTDQVIFKDSPAARDRVTREWRAFIVFLLFHQIPREG